MLACSATARRSAYRHRRFHRQAEPAPRAPALCRQYAGDVGPRAGRSADGKPLTLGDVAELEWGPQGMIGDAVINDGPGLMLIVEKFPWGNTLDITRGVEAALER